MTEQCQEKVITKLLYEDKRKEFKRFVEALKQKNGHGPSTSCETPKAVDSARQFLPVFKSDTDQLVAKIEETSDKCTLAALRKDVVSIEEDSLDGSIVAPKKEGKLSKKRRHSRALFKPAAKKNDGLVPVNVFMCQMKQSETKEKPKPSIEMFDNTESQSSNSK